MAKRSVNERDSERVKVDDEHLGYNLDDPYTVRLVLLKDIILNIDGPITNTHYKFNGAGSILEVDSRDAEIMLNRKGSGSCCSGASGPTNYFEMVR